MDMICDHKSHVSPASPTYPRVVIFFRQIKERSVAQKGQRIHAGLLGRRRMPAIDRIVLPSAIIQIDPGGDRIGGLTGGEQRHRRYKDAFIEFRLGSFRKIIWQGCRATQQA